MLSPRSPFRTARGRVDHPPDRDRASPQSARGATAGPAKKVRRFDTNATVEGIAIQDGEIWYAHDAEQIVLDVAEME